MSPGSMHKFLLILAVIFFGLYSWLYASDGNIFNSPDENATFVFSQSFAEKGDFFIEREAELDPLVRPRSTNIYEGKLVPGFFLGLPLLLGWASSLLGSWVLNYHSLLSITNHTFCLEKKRIRMQLPEKMQFLKSRTSTELICDKKQKMYLIERGPTIIRPA